MSTRFNGKPNSRFGIGGIPTGYDGLKDSSLLSIPSCGIEDVDVALFNLFNKEIPLHVNTKEGLRKVPVIVASGEKWAMLKKGRALRDENGSLILPLITIVKQDIVQSMEKDIAGRGTNQHTGELTIKRKLSEKDRGYQDLINKLFLKGQSGVAVGASDGPLSDQVVTSRDIGTLSDDPTIRDGGFLMSDLRNNIFEIITIPTPQYVTMKYEITIWSQYHQQMNEMIESIVSSYMPQTRGWRIDSPKGYWFVAHVSSDEFKSGDNAEDMTKQERIIKRTFSVDIPAFILASKTPGAPVAIKRYISNPTVSFGVSTSSEDSSENGFEIVSEPFLGSDDPTLPLSTKKPDRRDARDVRKTLLYPNKQDISTEDPALTSMKRGRKKSKWKRMILQDRAGNKVEKYVRLKSYNSHTGEMVLDGNDFDLGGLSIVSIDD